MRHSATEFARASELPENGVMATRAPMPSLPMNPFICNAASTVPLRTAASCSGAGATLCAGKETRTRFSVASSTARFHSGRICLHMKCWGGKKQFISTRVVSAAAGATRHVASDRVSANVRIV